MKFKPTRLSFIDENLDRLANPPESMDKEDRKAHLEAFDSITHKLAEDCVNGRMKREHLAYLLVKNTIKVLKEPESREFTAVQRADQVMQILLRIRAGFLKASGAEPN